MSPVYPRARPWRLLLLATALVASAALVMSPILYLRTVDALHQAHENRVDVCRDVNARHDAAIRKLDDLIAELPKAQRRRAAAGRKYTVALIEALTPRRDCGSSPGL